MNISQNCEHILIKIIEYIFLTESEKCTLKSELENSAIKCSFFQQKNEDANILGNSLETNWSYELVDG